MKRKKEKQFFIHLRVDLLGLSFELFEPYLRKIRFLLRTKLLDLLSFQASSDGNATVSILAYQPKMQHIGKRLACRASNPLIKQSEIMDGMKLNIDCKYEFILENMTNLHSSCPNFPHLNIILFISNVDFYPFNSKYAFNLEQRTRVKFCSSQVEWHYRMNQVYWMNTLEILKAAQL